MSLITLSPQTRACETGSGIVLLDLRRNRYFGLPASAAATLRRWVCNWPGWRGPVLEEQTLSDQDSAVLDPLFNAGLLGSAGPSGIPVTRSVGTAVATMYQMTPDHDGLQIRADHVARAAASCLRGRWLLSRSTLEVIHDRMVARRRAAVDGDDTRGDADMTRRLVRVYCRIRPWLYTARDACLLDAVSMAEFLAGYQIFPLWIVGVQAKPFRAHSWLQMGTTVLNDTVESVRQFQPILVA